MKNKKVSFWADMFSGANGGISSKRVLGSFILVVLLVVIVINTFWGNQNTWLGEAFITMLVGAFALLGIGVFEKNPTNLMNQDNPPKHEEMQEECNKEDVTP